MQGFEVHAAARPRSSSVASLGSEAKEGGVLFDDEPALSDAPDGGDAHDNAPRPTAHVAAMPRDMPHDAAVLDASMVDASMLGASMVDASMVGAAPQDTFQEPPPLLSPGTPARIVAAWRGLEGIVALLEDARNMAAFGCDGLLLLQRIVQTAPDPLRALAAYHAERLSTKWKGVNETLADAGQVDAGRVVEIILGLSALERAGQAHALLKVQVEEFCAKRKNCEEFLLGYEVSKTRPGDSAGFLHLEAKQVSTRHRAFCAALLAATHAQRLGLSLGNVACDDAEVLKKLPLLRPYLFEEDWDRCVDQLDVVFLVVDVFSNFGELRLNPSALPSEHAVVRDAAVMRQAIDRGDVAVVGDLARCARIFGAQDGDAVVESACDYLIRVGVAGDEGGVSKTGWPTRTDESTAYARFHAAAAAVGGLSSTVFRGFGPASSAQCDLLATWGAAGPPGLAACGVRLLPAMALKQLQQQYANERSGGPTFTFEENALRRLRGLLKWKQADARKSIDDYAADAQRRRLR
ncbi:hypothetical protein M885DRAFT_532054 [Pelagophyceae sp. CCMP2097]|nr:hypothetical protein M885DRAFT_532054 [Pelagophyceae sp. CCMP2097]